MERVAQQTESQQAVEPAFTEVQLIEVIAERAEGRGWTVERQPLVGVMRPDLTISPTPEMTLVIEVKLEVGPVHFAALGQVSTYRRALATVIDVPIHPVLITTGEVSGEISALADELCVHLVVASGEELEFAAESALEGLEHLIPALDREPQAASRSTDESAFILRSLSDHLERGEGREEIAQALNIGFRELADYYTELLTKLEATEPQRLDTVMNAWSEHAE